MPVLRATSANAGDAAWAEEVTIADSVLVAVPNVGGAAAVETTAPVTGDLVDMWYTVTATDNSQQSVNVRDAAANLIMQGQTGVFPVAGVLIRSTVLDSTFQSVTAGDILDLETTDAVMRATVYLLYKPS